MTSKLLTLMTTAAFALAPVAALSQERMPSEQAPNATSGDKDSPKMQKPGKIQKETDAKKNGTNQSESLNGQNKNGQPQP